MSRMRGNVQVRSLRGAGRSNAPSLPGELIGNFRAAGREWEPKGEPTNTNVLDFVD